MMHETEDCVFLLYGASDLFAPYHVLYNKTLSVGRYQVCVKLRRLRMVQ